MSTLLFSHIVADKYKEVSEVLDTVDSERKEIRAKSLKSMMQESFFHGASWMGQNFIA